MENKIPNMIDNQLIDTIISDNELLRNRSINSLLQSAETDVLLKHATSLNDFRISSENLYHKVRASLFLFVIHRFYLQENKDLPLHGEIPFEGIKSAFERNFERAISIYLAKSLKNGFNGSICSALADAYYRLAFAYLVEQVKLSISQGQENFHLFNTERLNDYPFEVAPGLTTPDAATGLYPIIRETCPVRIFLGMDYPEGAKVINISVDLKIYGNSGHPIPPCECYCRFIPEPYIYLKSIDLDSSKIVRTLPELFNFGNDYLSLLKAGVVASGIVPPCFEKKELPLDKILFRLLKMRGGIEIVTHVNDIPKGSRLAVSTTLLATIITCLMRFSGQISNLYGTITRKERRRVASMAILGEWLGGSGGGWQDSGGLWPGIKLITGKQANIGDPEYGISKGCLLPEHKVLSGKVITEMVENKILNSLVLVHGGISQDVGPILEMVTEKYLLRYKKEWGARQKGMVLFHQIVNALVAGEMKRVGKLTTADWNMALQPIIPTVNNAFTENLIQKVRNEFQDHYWGFLMLGGMSGGGMAFIVAPEVKERFKKRVLEIMRDLKNAYVFSFPFIIDPVVYDFAVNHEGNVSYVLTGTDALLPKAVVNQDASHVSISADDENEEISTIRERYGFEPTSHEHMKSLLKKGEIGLSRNRLPLSTDLSDASYGDLFHYENESANHEFHRAALEALKNNEVAVISFAGGLGSRWTSGAAVVKPISPFAKIEGKYRTFLEIHLAKTRKTEKEYTCRLPHIFTTSYLTHDAIESYFTRFKHFGRGKQIYLSPGKTIGHRVYPMKQDLHFFWEEQLQQKLDDNAQKVQDDLHKALIAWTASKGEGEDYTENRSLLRFNPPGHWYEIPNMLKNGVLARLLSDSPNLKYLFCHNIDTLGATVDPSLLGIHIFNEKAITFEVIPRRFEDRGGGLARIDGHTRLIESIALPREEDEYILSYYNTLTNWISIDRLLEFFNLNRELIIEADKMPELMKKIKDAIHAVEKRIPTYVIIKNVKYLWGSGQEDVYPVAQFEKLWGDMSALNDLQVGYVAVSRMRGQQLKDPAQLNTWLIDGSLDHVKKNCLLL
jgi:galactokinase/mevalonate kinase-like predicted kinase